jgi:hypothetical protein
MLLLKWMVVPVAVLAIAILLTLAGWSDSGWVVAGYCAVAVPTMFLWRKAAYRLAPSASNASDQELDDRSKRALMIRFVVTFGAALLIMLAVVLIIVFVPSARTTSGSFMALTLLVWASVVKFGVFNVLSHQVLKHSTFTTGAPQRPRR